MATFDVVLISLPTADVTIALTSSDTTEGTVSPSALTFTPLNWNLTQQVAITGMDDSEADGDVGYDIEIGPTSSLDPNDDNLALDTIAVMNADDESSASSTQSGSDGGRGGGGGGAIDLALLLILIATTCHHADSHAS